MTKWRCREAPPARLINAFKCTTFLCVCVCVCPAVHQTWMQLPQSFCACVLVLISRFGLSVTNFHRLSLSLSLTHMHTNTHTYTHIYIHTHTLASVRLHYLVHLHTLKTAIHSKWDVLCSHRRSGRRVFRQKCCLVLVRAADAPSPSADQHFHLCLHRVLLILRVWVVCRGCAPSLVVDGGIKVGWWSTACTRRVPSPRFEPSRLKEKKDQSFSPFLCLPDFSPLWSLSLGLLLSSVSSY